MSVLHLVKNYLNENEVWLRHQLEFAVRRPLRVAALRIVGHAPKIPDVEVIDDSPSSTVGRLEDLRDTSVFDAHIGRVLAHHSTTIVHAHFADTAWYYLPVLEHHYPRTVVSVYGADLSHLPTASPEWRHRYAEVFDRAGMVIVQGPAGVEHVLDWGCKPNRVRIVPLGIPSANIKARTNLARRHHPIRFLQAGYYRQKKGHFYTVSAFAKAFGDRRDARLTLVGQRPMSRDTGEYERLRRLAKDNGVNHLISWRPPVSYRDFLKLLDNHDFYVQPSVTTATKDVEGGPVAILDAQARGVPILATLHENIPELVDQGRSGHLTKERDIPGLARSMTEVADLSDSGYRDMQRAALAVAARFSSERLTRLCDQVYGEVLRQGMGSA